jgi:DNA-binding cell septation regulator SpoVG
MKRRPETQRTSELTTLRSLKTFAVGTAERTATVMSMSQGADRGKTVEVLAIKPLSNKGSLRAFVSVRLGGVVIHDCRVVQRFGQKAWVSLPQKEFTTKAGEKKYAPIVELSDHLKKQVNEAVLIAWERGAE